MATARATYPSRIVIDLTQSDEEDLQTAYNPVSREEALLSNATRTLPSITISKHGLVIRDGINLDAGQGPKKDNGISSRLGREARTRSLGITTAGSVRIPPSSHGGIHWLHNGSRKRNSRSTQHSFVPAATSPENDSVPLANTAKRRKTHGGMISETRSNDINAQRPNDQGVQINGSQPAHSRVESTSSPSSNSSFTKVRPLPTLNKSRGASDSLNQQPHKPRTYRLLKVNDRGSEERAMEALDAQVFKHVRSALQKFSKTLSKVERIQIATKVTHKLIDEPGFLDDFESHDWMLPRSYEAFLCTRAEHYVDLFTSRALHNSGELQSIEWTSSDSSNSPNGSSRSQSAQDVGQTIVPDMDSSPVSLISFQQGFSNLPQAALQNGNMGSVSAEEYISSPTTSFSNEPPDRILPIDAVSYNSKRPNAKKGKNSQKPRRSSRLLGSSRPPNRISSTDNIPTKSAIHPEQDINFLEYKPSIATIRETQVLRISGLRNVPRPYIPFADLADIRRGCEMIKGDAGRYLSQLEREFLEDSVLHVDFCFDEVKLLCRAATKSKIPEGMDLKSCIVSLMTRKRKHIAKFCKILEAAINRSKGMPELDLGWRLLQNRDMASISSFLEDAASGHVTILPQVVCANLTPGRDLSFPKPSISSLMREREIWGMAPFRVCHGRQPFNVELANHIEDSFIRRSEWTDCCGDISTVSWTSNHTFVCGATAHSDYHNMQYNKPGNLLVGSTLLDTLTAIDGHRIMRPVVNKAENAENSLESMRQTQDPWLYTSVVSTSYSAVSDYTFTASFDKTVKVWKVAQDGSSMILRGTWRHDGKVNFVVTSEHHDRVATASDVSSNAVRVYRFNEDDIPCTQFDTYSGDKAQEQAVALERDDSWAYFPATIQWGKAESVANLLLVGYSPRSNTGHELDIPQDKKNSGELCIWNTQDGQRVQISSARTQNMFEVIWHPTQPMFLAATSPCGAFEPETKTQIRLFALNKCGTFLHIKTLDCPALDINELCIQPTSLRESYVSASCTDGNTYVWDTAQGDIAIHILGHGASLDNPLHDLPLEIADSGVKFASWGRSTGRFYTGSSDGKVKAWDVRAPSGEAFVRTILSVSGGISGGAFSKNYSKLLIGDATGKVHLIEVDGSEDLDCGTPPVAKHAPVNAPINQPAIELEGSRHSLQRPKVVIPHPEPPPPGGPNCGIDEPEQTAHSMAQVYIEKGQLTLHPDHGIGAIQGPNYAETLLYRFEAHEDDDGTKPLRPEWSTRQQYHLHNEALQLQVPRLPFVPSSNLKLHNTNMALDLDISRLSPLVRESFVQDRVDLDFEESYKFDLEPTPRYEIFKMKP